MLHQLTIPRKTSVEASFDHQQLFAMGLQHVKRLAGRIWTDYNVHDPGITTLELLCYALTDLSYRASFPVNDLVASPSDNATNMEKQFFTARRIFPNRSLTLSDYRKLLIDLKGVRNAWLLPSELTYYADTVKGKLLRERADLPGIAEVSVAGLYDVVIDYEPGSDEPSVLTEIQRRLHANRCLCEDFVSFTKVGEQAFNLCCELELSPDAETSMVKAEILFQIQEYLAPPVRNYTLSEMLDRKKPEGSTYGADEIFDGPVLDCGFIDDAELEKAELRSEIRLSDIISIIMDIKGVLAVRDIVINPQGTDTPLEEKWTIPVAPGKKALLNVKDSRLIFYKRNMPVPADSAQVDAYYSERVAAARVKAETAVRYDLPVPLGTFRQPGTYTSFQNHFPALYGLSDVGLGSTGNVEADGKRKALAFQLKAYLLFCDQVMADYFAQLNHVKDLFSTDPQLRRTYFHQAVDSFADYRRIYNVADGTEEAIREEITKLLNGMDDGGVSIDRRNRFLDHLIARFAERFSEFVQVMYSAFGSTPENMVALKCDFLNHYPEISSERSLAYNSSLKNDEDLWDTQNVSGLEKRLAKLLGIRNFKRRNLGDIADNLFAEEGMYLIENILLRPEQKTDAFLPISPAPGSPDGLEVDPYSYRFHIILPAYGSRFQNMEFRRFAEEVIREETPAHILPKICWITQEEMVVFEKHYRDWVYLKSGAEQVGRTNKLNAFIEILFTVRNLYPEEKLRPCAAGGQQPKFVLGQTALGTMKGGEA